MTSTTAGIIEWLDAFGDDLSYAGTQANRAELSRRAHNGDMAAARYLGISSIVTYYANRDTARAQASDEDRAMAHQRIYQGDDLSEAQTALYCAMQDEATWLARPDYRSPASLRRAADIIDGSNRVNTLEPEPGKSWSAASVEAAGIRWQIIRTERPTSTG